jgi:heme exporter protein A
VDASDSASAPDSNPTRPGTAQAILEVEGLTRDFGTLRAVDDIGFSLDAGRLLTVFGPNGAGKTTLLRILAGGLRPTAGSVTLAGRTLRTGDPEWYRSIGVLSHRGFLYGHLTARENLRYFGTLFGLADLADRVPERLEHVGLASRADSAVRTFSRGMRQRLALARCLLHDPDFVLLDEPYTGLDAHASAVLREVLASLKDGRRTVILVTHNLSQGLELADSVAVQVHGRFVSYQDRAGIEPGTFEATYRRLVEEAES